jgi:hypothetical protein
MGVRPVEAIQSSAYYFTIVGNTDVTDFEVLRRTSEDTITHYRPSMRDDVIIREVVFS